MKPNIQECTDRNLLVLVSGSRKNTKCLTVARAVRGSLDVNWDKALSFNFHLENDSGSNRTAEKNMPKTNIDYVRVPVIQKLAEEELPNSIESWNEYHQVDSPALSSSDEIIVV